MRVLALLVLALALVPAARADGDPASDVLYAQDLFVPYNNVVPESVVSDLNDTIADANKAGYKIKVAMIADKVDLGLIVALWRKPKQYAPFLGRELILFYKDTLLITMPNGFGVFRNEEDVSREEALLAKVKIRPGGEGLGRATLTAVRRLAAAAGHPLPPPGKDSGQLLDRLLIVGGALLVLLVLALGGRALHRRRRAPSEAEPAEAPGR